MRRDEALAILNEHRDEIRGFGVKSIAIFGSVARDEARPDSDVDVLVEFNRRPLGLFEFLDLKMFLEQILGVGVDLATPASLKERIRPSVERDIIDVHLRLASSGRRYPAGDC